MRDFRIEGVERIADTFDMVVFSDSSSLRALRGERAPPGLAERLRLPAVMISESAICDYDKMVTVVVRLFGTLYAIVEYDGRVGADPQARLALVNLPDRKQKVGIDTRLLAGRASRMYPSDWEALIPNVIAAYKMPRGRSQHWEPVAFWATGASRAARLEASRQRDAKRVRGPRDLFAK